MRAQYTLSLIGMLINIPSTDSPHFKDQYLLARSTCWLTHSTQDYEEIKISEEYEGLTVELTEASTKQIT